MPLTSAQLLQLQNYIASVPALANAPAGSDGAFFIAAEMNKPASPAWTIWKTSVSIQLLLQEGLVWTEVDNLTVGKARIWDWMSRMGSINPSSPNIRAGLTEAFSQSPLTTANSVPLLKKTATVAQKLFSTGTGSNGSPATIASNLSADFELTYQDVEEARNYTAV